VERYELVLTLRAECELNLGLLAQARNDYRTAILLFSKLPPKTDFQKAVYIVASRGLADLERKEQKLEAALQGNEKALALCKQFQFPPFYRIERSWHYLRPVSLSRIWICHKLIANLSS
jgi:tetratricopeptide (TPR) repeat protein